MFANIVELVFLLGWIWWNRERDLFPELDSISNAWRVLSALIPPACCFWLDRMRRRARRELARLEDFEPPEEL